MSSFAQTCNLLSQYLKEKRSLAITPSPRIEPKEDEFPTDRPPAIKKVAPGEAAPPSSAQMTIFYGGQVMVFNDLPSERAEEIMAMAGKGIVSSSEQQPPIKVSGDLPIARRASLHRFLEKRKDRAAVRAPYQLHYSGSSKPAGHNGNQQSSNHFDLNL